MALQSGKGTNFCRSCLWPTNFRHGKSERCKSCATKNRFNDTDYKKRVTEYWRKFWARPEMREVHKKLFSTPEMHKKLSLVHMGHLVSEATKAKTSASNIGKVVSEKTKEKLRNMSLEAREKLRKFAIGRHHTLETRAKLRFINKGKWMGEKSPSWKGGRKTSTNGYECIRIHPRFYIAIHRQNMEKTLGRSLKREEVVHHINGIKKDNRIENLALCSNQAAHKWCDIEEAKIFPGGGR